MKVKILSVVLLFFLIASVIANTFFLTRKIEQIISDIQSASTENTHDSAGRITEIFDNYQKAEGFLSLTVSHNDLSDINGYFTELMAYLSLGNAEEASVAKSRLIDALLHLKRLSGWNIQAIF